MNELNVNENIKLNIKIEFWLSFSSLILLTTRYTPHFLVGQFIMNSNLALYVLYFIGVLYV